MEPSRDDVRQQLERLLASEYFANAERARRFLRYVVERTLAGEGDHLKEFVIGVDVFDRDDQYDPRIDSIVRVEAGRLRSKLDQYYARAGENDQVVIRVPRGSYVPEFGFRTAQPLTLATDVPPANRRARPLTLALCGGVAAVILAVLSWNPRANLARQVPIPETRASDNPAPTVATDPPRALSTEPPVQSTQPPPAVRPASRPAPRAPVAGPAVRPEPPASIVSVIVLPFEHFSTDKEVQLLAARFTDGVTSELARIDYVSVVSRTSALQLTAEGRTLRDIARALDAQVVVEGSLLVEAMRVEADVRIVDTVVDRKSWSRQFTGEVSDLRALQRRVAADVAAFVRPRS